ncbi:hypothetical protein [Kingella oralis]|nr:hypothetical protein [Kingella oralis]
MIFYDKGSLKIIMRMIELILLTASPTHFQAALTNTKQLNHPLFR